jgi:hypothetical protein
VNLQANPKMFQDLFTFLETGVKPSQEANNPKPLSLDFRALP